MMYSNWSVDNELGTAAPPTVVLGAGCTGAPRANAGALLPAAQLAATVTWITVQRVAVSWCEMCVLRMKMKEERPNENEIMRCDR